MTELKKPRLLKRGEPLEQAVYCAKCKYFKEPVIGSKIGTCLGHMVPDSTVPVVCPGYVNDIKVLSVFVFLNSGVSVYHKAIVKDIENQMDPQLFSSFLEAINLFGNELTAEPISQIQFQKMNILMCRGNHACGALLLKGEVNEDCKEMFSRFLVRVENQFHDYFKGDFTGISLPEEEVDSIALTSMREYIAKRMYKIPTKPIENSCNMTCAQEIE